jgi:rhodanese-related sulfurtransferase
MVGANVMDGLLTQINWQQAAKAVSDPEVCFVDLRTKGEREKGYIVNSLHIPLPELRDRMGEVPAGKKIITYCQSGQRSYMAYRTLKQAGFDVKNLAGGFLTWKAANLESSFQHSILVKRM